MNSRITPYLIALFVTLSLAASLRPVSLDLIIIASATVLIFCGISTDPKFNAEQRNFCATDGVLMLGTALLWSWGPHSWNAPYLLPLLGLTIVIIILAIRKIMHAPVIITQSV